MGVGGGVGNKAGSGDFRTMTGFSLATLGGGGGDGGGFFLAGGGDGRGGSVFFAAVGATDFGGDDFSVIGFNLTGNDLLRGGRGGEGGGEGGRGRSVGRGFFFFRGRGGINAGRIGRIGGRSPSAV